MKYERVHNPAFENNLEDSLKQNLRNGFVRKVYGILAMQLTATAIVCFLSRTFPMMLSLVNALRFPTTLGVLVSLIWLTWSKTASKQVPKNFILLGVFTICESFALSSMIQFVSPDVVSLAFFFTAGVTIALTMYAMSTKKDITMQGATVSILLSSFSMVVFASIMFNPKFLSTTLYLLLATIVYAYYLVYHTQLIVGGGQGGQVDLDDYIKAALTLYIDIIQLFIKILRIIEKLQSKQEEKKKNSN